VYNRVEGLDNSDPTSNDFSVLQFKPRGRRPDAPHAATLVGGHVGEVPAATLVGGGVPRSAPVLPKGAVASRLGARIDPSGITGRDQHGHGTILHSMPVCVCLTVFTLFSICVVSHASHTLSSSVPVLQLLPLLLVFLLQPCLFP
jgi:hypothetical protein